MATHNPAKDETIPPIHQIGTILTSPPDYHTIATFPPGSFLENLAVRHDGTLLVSDMLSGSIWYVDPRQHGATQETIQLVHKFELEDHHTIVTVDGGEEEESHDSYSSTPAAEAIIESPEEGDVFYIASGIHGKKGTWWIYELDMRSFTPNAQSSNGVEDTKDAKTHSAATATSNAKITRLEPISAATWLNGGTTIQYDSHTVLLAESYQGRIYSYNIKTRKVEVWLEDPLLGKITARPPWPGVNGIQGHNTGVWFTNSDRGILGYISTLEGSSSGEEGRKADIIEVVATGCGGDDLDIDNQGNVYVATNPANTVLKFPRIATIVRSKTLREGFHIGKGPCGELQRYDHRYEVEIISAVAQEPERQVILGLDRTSGLGLPAFDPETTGPTAVALADTANRTGDLYVVTNGGIINPLDGVVREAKVLRVDLTAWKQWKLDQYGRYAVEDSVTH
ncbi:hypothetical protein H2200_010748 [Cladophialophora chaetospira]|uniref:SMP-30/Gluconolactonase/LRE-like region domain-containing protein n=1 Tax=Cladophialophora chaetospira TaxID=386627 RepID=A0AA38X0P6_9EURO|nr:hypothetical protein H2200_010748 [Cladophialophora chaetospira]